MAKSKSCNKKYYRIDRREVHFLRFIMEGYDGVAVMQTIDAEKGLVVLHVAPGCEPEVDMIVGELKKRMRISALPSLEEEFLLKGNFAPLY